MTGFSKVDMDSVAPLLPANRTAAQVAGKGEHFAHAAPEWHVHSSNPLPVRLPTKLETQDPNFVDLRGAKLGRLTVVGIFEGAKTHNGRSWVVRCACGSYEIRKTKFIKKCVSGNDTADDPPRCDWCGKTRKLQLGIGVKRDGPLMTEGKE